jgi:hypothetical protein
MIGGVLGISDIRGQYLGIVPKAKAKYNADHAQNPTAPFAISKSKSIHQ